MRKLVQVKKSYRIAITCAICSAASLQSVALLAQQSAIKGKLHFSIHNQETGDLLPGKLVFLQGDTIVDLGISSTGTIASRNNTVYSLTGSGEIELSAGTYEVWAGRGIEYSADVQHITILAGEETKFQATIRRMVQTPGYVCGDMHLHTYTYSGHGDSRVDERIISCIGEGLEWAVATDHNHITDYSGTINALHVADEMLTTVGNEISTPIGHFNAYPLPSGSQPTDHTSKDANALFKLIRDIGDNVVIQINHPRWPGGDYFTILGLDQNFNMSDDPFWSWNFDAFELLNENRGLGWVAEPGSPISVRDDWYNMLNSGHQFTAVGNSDSHTVLSILAGIPRNYIASSTDDPADMDEAELVASIKNRNVSVNRGLYVEFGTADGGRIGELRTANEDGVTFDIRVQAPDWVECDSVFLVANGKTVASFSAQSTKQALRFERRVSVRPQVDTWYIAVASGSKSMAPLIHDAPVPITPLGFTNPIWIDADGNGRFTSLYEHAGQIVEENTNSPDKLVAQIDQNPALRRFAIKYLAEKNVANEIAIYEHILAQSPLDERLFIYKQLAKSRPAATAKAMLQKYSASVQSPLEKAVLVAALAQLGATDQWSAALAAVQEAPPHRYLDDVLRKMSTGTFIREWQVSAPYHYSASHGLDSVFAPESNLPQAEKDLAEKIEWRTLEASPEGIVNLSDGIGTLRKVVVYAKTEFTSSAAGDMLFLIGSDDGVAVWLNGKEVHRNDAHRGVVPGDDIAIARIQRGKNQLLVKIENGGGNWGFCVEPVDVHKWLTF